MYEWIIKISAMSVALGAIGYILPKGTLRKTSLVALSFLFLSVMVMPLGNFAANLMGYKTKIDIEKDLLLSKIEGNNVYAEVMTEYKKKIEEEVQKAFARTKYKCVGVNVNVNENSESETFGEVTSVFCHMSYEENKSGNTIDKVTVPEINIDWGGVHIGKKDDITEDGDTGKYDKEIKEIVSSVTGAEIGRIYVRWER